MTDSPKPSREYFREPLAESQLADLVCLPVARIVSLTSASTGDVCEEVLVALVRHMQRLGETDAAWRIALALAGRVKHKIAQTLRVWRLDSPESIAEEVIEEVVSTLYTAVFDLSPKAAFWEIRFWVAFNRSMLNIVRRKRDELDHELLLEGSPADQRADGDEVLDYRDAALEIQGKRGVGDNRMGIDMLDPLSGALAAEALARLPRAERIAYILKYAACLPEDSSRDAGVLTIARVLGVSGRSIRNYLSRAEHELESWRAGRPEKRRRGPASGKPHG